MGTSMEVDEFGNPDAFADEVREDSNHKPDKSYDDSDTVLLCPICHKPAQKGYLPFCSKRCSDIDLSRWFNGVYSVPLEEHDEEDIKELSNLTDECT